ncbi:MAG: glycosyltransferase [Myxococcales bacterium]|nr:glycosyltransferase [Myxococcales bacterium]MCB9649036.1 glycosyltransferase [Deltaproteobacteria bacterium]
MRVLHILDISVPVLAGYTSRSRYIVLNQKALGIDPVVLTSVRQENPTDCSMEELDGIRYYRTHPPAPGLLDAVADKPVARELMEIHHLRRRIVEVAKREDPDLIHAHSSILCGIPGLLAARELGIPCVYEIRAFWEDAAVDLGRTAVGSPRYVATQKAETLLAKQADGVIGICQGIKKELVQRGLRDRDVHVIPNGVEVDRFTPLPKDPAVMAKYGLEGKTVVAYIGTFHAWEGVRFLVEALVKLIKGGRDDIRGLIVGAGHTYEECRKIAVDAGLEQAILHPGRVPHDEVQSIYSVVDILAYPRDRQRITELVTPLKPLEAMAMEKAVIGSDVGGITELVSDGETGLIFRAEDVGDLAEKIRTLADDPALRERLGKAGRRYVCETRQWRRIIEGHFEVYDQARANWTRSQFLWKGLARVLEPIKSAGL